jgi:branched-chain amino acid transport system substrate-binding protein
VTSFQAISKHIAYAVLLVAAIVLAGCTVSPSPQKGTPAIAANPNVATNPSAASQSQPSAQSRVSKIGLLLPLSGTGTTAAIAKGMKQAAELALFDGGSSSVQLIVKDDLGTAEGASAAAEEVIKEGVELIIGPLFANSVRAVAPAARRANVPVVAFSNDPQVAGNGVYLVSFLVRQDIDRIVAYCVAQGRKRFAALVTDDAYGQLMGTLFRQAVSAHGGSIKAFEIYPVQGGNAVLEPARKLVDGIKRADEDGEPVQAVFVPGGADSPSNLGPLLVYAGLDTSRSKLIGTGAWDQAQLGRETAFVGGWFAAPEPRGWQEFSEKFGKTYGSAPPRIATLAYDAVSLAVQLSSLPPGQRYSSSTLASAVGFQGADGAIRFTSDGTPQRHLAILEVQRVGVTIVDPAPTTF